MGIVEQKISAGDRPIFDLGEFLTRPLYAHLAHSSEQGPRESPVWFHWDGQAFWIIGGKSFPANLKREPRCALGIVDWNAATGRSHHVGVRGRAEVLPFDSTMARTIFRRYFGPDEKDWDRRFDDVFTGELHLEMVRVIPETIVVRDQSYKPTPWAQQRPKMLHAAIDTGRVRQRRIVRLQTVDDLVAEMERLIVAAGAGEVRPLGNWSPAQVLWHIGKLMELSFDGFSWRYRRGPQWITRPFRFLAWRWLIRLAFRPGFKNPPEAAVLEPPATVSLDDAVGYLRRQIGRIRSGEKMTQESAVEGPYSHEQWLYIHLRHAELHLSFLTIKMNS